MQTTLKKQTLTEALKIIRLSVSPSGLYTYKNYCLIKAVKTGLNLTSILDGVGVFNLNLKGNTIKEGKAVVGFKTILTGEDNQTFQSNALTNSVQLNGQHLSGYNGSAFTSKPKHLIDETLPTFYTFDLLPYLNKVKPFIGSNQNYNGVRLKNDLSQGYSVYTYDTKTITKKHLREPDVDNCAFDVLIPKTVLNALKALKPVKVSLGYSGSYITIKGISTLKGVNDFIFRVDLKGELFSRDMPKPKYIDSYFVVNAFTFKSKVKQLLSTGRDKVTIKPKQQDITLTPNSDVIKTWLSVEDNHIEKNVSLTYEGSTLINALNYFGTKDVKVSFRTDFRQNVVKTVALTIQDTNQDETVIICGG